jgi:hypothetical protein
MSRGRGLRQRDKIEVSGGLPRDLPGPVAIGQQGIEPLCFLAVRWVNAHRSPHGGPDALLR